MRWNKKKEDRTPEDYQKKANEQIQKLKNQWKTFFRTGPIVIAAVIVMIALSIAWFVSNTMVDATGVQISAAGFFARIEKDSLPKRSFRLERLSFLYRFYHNEIRESDAAALCLLFFNGRIVALLEEAFCGQRRVRYDGFCSDKLSPSGL